MNKYCFSEESRPNTCNEDLLNNYKFPTSRESKRNRVTITGIGNHNSFKVLIAKLEMRDKIRPGQNEI